MRLLCEIFVIGALIYLGWEKPFNEWLHSKPPAARPLVRVSPTPSSAWMRDPSRRTALDTPVPLNTPPVRTNFPQHSPSASGSWMWDTNHRSALDPPHKSSTPR
jgi:hypothetical protein